MPITDKNEPDLQYHRYTEHMINVFMHMCENPGSKPSQQYIDMVRDEAIAHDYPIPRSKLPFYLDRIVSDESQKQSHMARFVHYCLLTDGNGSLAYLLSTDHGQCDYVDSVCCILGKAYDDIVNDRVNVQDVIDDMFPGLQLSQLGIVLKYAHKHMVTSAFRRELVKGNPEKYSSLQVGCYLTLKHGIGYETTEAYLKGHLDDFFKCKEIVEMNGYHEVTIDWLRKYVEYLNESSYIHPVSYLSVLTEMQKMLKAKADEYMLMTKQVYGVSKGGKREDLTRSQDQSIAAWILRNVFVGPKGKEGAKWSLADIGRMIGIEEDPIPKYVTDRLRQFEQELVWTKEFLGQPMPEGEALDWTLAFLQLAQEELPWSAWLVSKELSETLKGTKPKKRTL